MSSGLAVEALACMRGGRHVFAGLSFRANPGDLVRLIGPNGSGKSSLLRLLAGLSTPAAGAIRFDDRSIADDPGAHRGRVFYVGHKNAVKPWLTARENLAFWTAWGGSPAAAVDAALDGAGLRHVADLPAAYLSFGQSRRLALARMGLAADAAVARLILLDEPTAGLDSGAEARLLEAVAAARATGAVFVVATHGEIPGASATVNLGDHVGGAGRRAL